MAGERRSGRTRPARATPDETCSALAVLIDDQRGRAVRPRLGPTTTAERAVSGAAVVSHAVVSVIGAPVDRAPGSRRTFSSRNGPVTLAHDRPTASRRSVRAVALAAGAHINDTWLLGFSARGDIDVGVRRHTGDSLLAEPTSTGADLFPNSATSGAT
ncbi:MAG: hypothetical protein M3083_22725 [Actinomycetota bacterium]|nr:hypothetical protein [Actinomycetota bacterium]